MAGSVQMTATAAISPHSVPTAVTNPASPVVIVRALELVSTEANRYSFQAKSQVSSAVVAMPGAASGMITRQRIPITEQPSIIAASSSSVGMPSTIPFSNQMANGRLNRQ